MRTRTGTLAYGGNINHEGVTIEERNYVHLLSCLIRDYWPEAKNIGKKNRLEPLLNYIGYPIYDGITEVDKNEFGKYMKSIKIKRPKPLGISGEELGLSKKGFFKADTPACRFTWSRGMTAMRQAMTKDIDARLAMGGKLNGYMGIYPGVLEEIMLMLKANKPVYLVVAFGSAVRLAIDILINEPREKFKSSWFSKNIKKYNKAIGIYKKVKVPFKTPEEIEKALKAFAVKGLAKVLNNGLSDNENRELFFTTNPRRVVELVLSGLQRKFSGKAGS